MRDTQRERQRYRQREKQTPCRELDAGLDPRTPESYPEPKTDAQPLSHPGALVYPFKTCWVNLEPSFKKDEPFIELLQVAYNFTYFLL